jgi:hypothetical protein
MSCLSVCLVVSSANLLLMASELHASEQGLLYHNPGVEYHHRRLHHVDTHSGMHLNDLTAQAHSVERF